MVKLRLLCAVLLVAAVATTAQAELILQDGLNGYAGTQDTYIRGGAADHLLNFGAQPWISAHGNPSGGYMLMPLIRFDDIFGTGPNQWNPGHQVCSAIMKLYCNYSNPYSEGSYVYFTDMVTPGEQGTGTEAVNEGEVCGQARRYRADGDYAGNPGDAWGTAGQASPSGDTGPRIGVDTGGAFINCAIPSDAGVWMDFDVTDVLEAYRLGASHTGFYGRSSAWWPGLNWVSSEDTADISLRPKLVLVPEPITLLLLAAGLPLLRRKRRA